MKKLLLAVLFLLIIPKLSAQSINTPTVVLSGIDFNLKVEGINDSIKQLKVTFENENIKHDYLFNVSEGKIDSSFSINTTGNYLIISEGFEEKTIRVLPPILSIIPPIIAILFAFFIRHVLLALLAGIYVGTIFIFDYNPLTGLLRLLDTFIINALVDPSHMMIIIFTMFFGGVVGLISNNGGTKGMANLLTNYAKNRKTGMTATWFMGICIFFDDYANTLIVGNLMRPISDKLKISREKLAFIVDSTSAPVASIFIISTWIGFEIGLIQDGLNIIGSTENAYGVFLETIPYRFYPIAMLIFVLAVALMQKDFGPMLKAERKALLGENDIHNSANEKDLIESSAFNSDVINPRWYNGAIPVFVLIIGTLIGLVTTGLNSINEQGLNDYSIRNIISNSDSYMALIWSSFAGCLTAIIMTVWQKIKNLADTIDIWYKGLRSMLFPLILLTLAWTISAVTSELKTADFIIHNFSDKLNPHFLPVLVFLTCAVTSFATGSSWGVMAIMMPIVVPLADQVGLINNLSPDQNVLILHGVISSVLAGSVFGDHCSPIADTTILSSMASSCDHMSHVKTQMPYAILTAVVCMLLGDIPTAYGFSPYFSIILISGVLISILYFFGKRAES